MSSISSIKSQQSTAKQKPPRLIAPHTHRNIRNISVFILLLSLCLLAWSKINDPQILPIHHVKIGGHYSHVDKIAVQQTILPFLKRGFVNIDIEGLSKALQGLAWVDNVNITRVWPDQLVIHLIEHTPVAQWNRQGILDNKGTIFIPDNGWTDNLPMLKGPDGQQMFIWQNYQQLNAQLAPLGLKIVHLYLSARQAWNLELSNGIKVALGRVDPALRLQRLIAAYPQVVGSHSNDIDYIDMRYTSGMAVKWKTNL